MTTQRIYRRHQLLSLTGLGYTAIYELIKENKFPKPIRLSAKAVGWLESDIAQWQQARISEREHQHANPKVAV